MLLVQTIHLLRAIHWFVLLIVYPFALYSTLNWGAVSQQRGIKFHEYSGVLWPLNANEKELELSHWLSDILNINPDINISWISHSHVNKISLSSVRCSRVFFAPHFSYYHEKQNCLTWFSKSGTKVSFGKDNNSNNNYR